MPTRASYRKRYAYIGVLLLLILPCLLQAQKKSQRFDSAAPSKTFTLLEEARSMRQENPAEATKVIDQFIAAKVKAGNKQGLEEAYILLGDINYENGLYANAVERYFEARKYSSVNNHQLLLKIGQSYLEYEPERAQTSFQQCLDQAPNNKLCQEGLADAYLNTGDVDNAITIFKNLEQYYNRLDPIATGRVQAKLSLAYAAQRNVSEAYSNYNNALQNIPPSVKDKNRSILKEASDSLSSQQSVAEQRVLRETNVRYYADDAGIENESDVALEQLELVDVYVESGATIEAEEALADLKGNISSVDDVEVKAKFFKKESDLYAYKGDYESAVQAFRQYTTFQDSVYDLRLARIDKKINLQNAQSSADLNISSTRFERDKLGYEEQLVDRKQWIIYLLSSLLLGSLIGGYFLYRSDQKRKKSNKLLELRSLRSEMNPHFIFNALGNVNEYIAASDERKANRFLSDFSKLMRNVLEHNQEDLIPLRKEIELSKLYLKLEHARWRDQFEYTIDIVDEDIPDILVPPLILQPYLENAVWHGLRYREDGGKLVFALKSSTDMAHISISDNGIGRAQSAAIKTKHQKAQKSTGIQNTKRRATLLNELYQKKVQVNITDASNNNDAFPGTLVEIKLPL